MITHSTAEMARAADEGDDVKPGNYDIDPPDVDGDSWGGSGDPPPIQVNFSR